MKKLLTSLFVIALAIFPSIAAAQFTVPQGGTGYNAIQSGALLFGNTSLRLGTSTDLIFNDTSDTLTVGTTTADNFCLTGDDCISTWPTGGGGSGTVENIGPAGQFANGPDVTLATSSDTNIGLTITGSGDTLTFTSNWIGTLADSRVSDTLTIGSGSTVADGALSANVSLLGSTIGVAELASADFGDFTCNGSTCTIDSGVVAAADLATADFGDFSCSAGTCTIDSNSIALATDTTGNYVATVSSSGSITVGNSGSENAAVTVNLNMGNANTWTALQTFGNTAATNATTSALDVTSLLTFGGVTGNSWDDFCVAITGGAGLCDGTDGTGGGGGGLATSTPIADTYVIYGTSASDVGAEAAFNYDDATNVLTVGSLSLSTALSVANGGTGQTTLSSSQLLYGNGTGAIQSVATTTLTASSPLALSQPVVKVGGTNSVLSLDTSGTWTGNAGTASALASNGSNCSAGSFPLGVDASGAAESCTDAWTEAENTAAAYAAQATTITIAGTANQITSSAGAQSLAANRTWTLSIPSQFNIQNASTTALSTGLFWAGQTATTSIAADGSITIGGNIVFAGDTIDELVGTGLQVSSGDLQTTLGTSITVGELASADFGDFTCNGSTCTIDSGVVAAADLATADFGDFSCSAGTCTVDANAIALSTDTTGNYLATLADDGQSTITVNNSGTEGAAVTLRVIDVVCTDCLTTTEIADSYLLNNGDVGTGNYDFGGASFFEIPNGTAPTADDPGEIAHDTTDNQLIVDDYVMARGVQKIWSVTVASTSPAFISGGLLKVPTELDGYTITAIRCSVQGGTNKVIAVEDESANSSEDITCTTSVTSDDGSITNATYTAAEEAYIDFGSTSGSVDYVSVSVFGTWTRE